MAEPAALVPLGDGLGDEARALAESLRTLFASLDMSATRYAALAYMDKSTLSRFLSGKRVPSWGFIHTMLVHATEAHDGVPPTVEVVSHLRALHHAALEAGGSPRHQIMLLQERLSEAHAEARRAGRHEKDLEQALQEAQRDLAGLQVSNRSLEAKVDRDRERFTEELRRFQIAVRQEHEELHLSIAQLREELARTKERKQIAEDRVAELERQLDRHPAESAGPFENASPAVPAIAPTVPATDKPRVFPAATATQSAAQSAAAKPGTAQSGATESGAEPTGSEAARPAAADLEFMPRDMVARALARLALDRTVDIVKNPVPGHADEGLTSIMLQESAEALGRMDAFEAGKVLDGMQPTRAAALLVQIPEYQAGEMLSRMTPDRAAAALESMGPPQAAAKLSRIRPDRAGEILDFAATGRVLVTLLDLMAPAKVGAVLAAMNPTRALTALNRMTADRAAEAFHSVADHARTARILNRLTSDRAAALLSRLDPEQAGRIADAMKSDRVGAAMELMSAQQAGAIRIGKSQARAVFGMT